MKKQKFTKKEKYEIDIVLIIILIIIFLFLVDFIDINEKLGFPTSLLDEPLMIIFGVILGYLIAKFKFVGLMKRELQQKVSN